MKNCIACVLVGVILSLAGCGDANGVSGKVMFSDGTPLTCGTVQFNSATHTFHGAIGPDGKYTVTSAQNGTPLPPDKYRVCIDGAFQANNADQTPIPKDADGNEIGPPRKDVPPTPLVAEKYTRATTSGLECDVKGKVVFDIQVEKP